MKIYIAGKIAGDVEYKDKFAAAEIELILRGHTVINPSVLPIGLSKGDYIRICLPMIDAADAVRFLPDYADSAGAMLELLYCKYIGKPYAPMYHKQRPDWHKDVMDGAPEGWRSCSGGCARNYSHPWEYCGGCELRGESNG